MHVVHASRARAGRSSIPAMTLDKAHVARRLLGAALALFLEDLDPIVVHVLACSAGEVAEYLAVKASGQPFTARALATFRNNEINSGVLSDTQQRMTMTKMATAGW